MLKDVWYYLHSHLLPLFSFGDILAVSICCNLAYLLINANRESKYHTAIFAFIIDYLENKRKKSLDKYVDEKKKKFLEHKYLRFLALQKYFVVLGRNNAIQREDEETEAFLISRIQDLRKGLDYIEKKKILIKNSFLHENCLKSEFMPCIVFSCILYSLILLIFSAFENKTDTFYISFHHIVSILNCVIFIIAIHCIIFAYSSEKNQKKWCRPSLGSCFFVLGFFLLIGCFPFPRVDIIYSNIAYLLSVFFCWIGILIYLFSGLFYIILVNRRCKRDINELNEEEKQHEIDSRDYYLQKIEQKFNSLEEKLKSIEEKSYSESVRDPNDFKVE